MVNELLAILFLSREVAHKEHLKTDSFAQHMALGSFYEDLIPLADKLAEVCQGRTGKLITDIPSYSSESKGNILSTLKKLLERVEETRKECYPDDSAIQNIIDEIVALYLSTIYKLTFLK